MNENLLLESLPPQELATLLQQLKSVDLDRGQILAHPGDDMERVYFPHSGVISYLVELNDGSHVQTLMVGRDGVVGAPQALDNRRSINLITVQIAGQASMINRADFRNFVAEHRSARDKFAAHEQFAIADIQQTAACNARHPTEQRMARWLLRTRDLVGSEFNMTQEVVAAMLGVRRSSVSNVAAKMQSRGMINYARGRLTVVDESALRRSACECNEAVRENYEVLLNES